MVQPNQYSKSPEESSSDNEWSSNLEQEKHNKKKRKLAPSELIISTLIVGLLVAIFLPSFFNNDNNAKSSDAKQALGSLSRSQQAHFLENGNFITDMSSMRTIHGGHRIEETRNYIFLIRTIGREAVQQVALPKYDSLKTYISIVKVRGEGSEVTTEAIMCEGIKEQKHTTRILIYEVRDLPTDSSCPQGFENVRR